MSRSLGSLAAIAAVTASLAVAAPAQAAPFVTVRVESVSRTPVGIGAIVTAVCSARASTSALFTRSTCTVAGAAQTVTAPGIASVSASTSATSLASVVVCADGAASDLSGTFVAPPACVTG
ncbi:MAG: hypothetical protein QOE45_3333 [Frankiaceae bacterium]|jgi:hypothetical protein|nr:hypothetical protein [Frankiaceae bacterium]